MLLCSHAAYGRVCVPRAGLEQIAFPPIDASEQNGRRCVCSRILNVGSENSMLGTVLLVILILLLIGALPNWGYSRGWGYGPSGGLGLILVIVIILLLMGRI